MRIRSIAGMACLLIVAAACSHRQPEEAREHHLKTGFYELYSDWDILYVPVIEPYRASSIDQGENWLLSNGKLGDFEVMSLGVSGNFIYGRKDEKTWFLEDTQSPLHAVYESEEALEEALAYLKVPMREIRGCKAYFDQLADEKRPYWYPAKGQKYAIYPALQPVEFTILEISGNAKPVGFSVPEEIHENTGKIQFFKVKFDQDTTDLLFLSFDASSPVAVKKDLVIPVFVADKYLDITLYTPFPIADEHKIPENERIRILKTVHVIH